MPWAACACKCMLSGLAEVLLCIECCADGAEVKGSMQDGS